MAVKNVGGHAVTDQALGHNTEARSTHPSFNEPAGHSGYKAPKGNHGFPPAGAPTKAPQANPSGGVV